MVAAVVVGEHLHKGQKVNFIGGTGTIKSYFPDAGSWSYLVEMEMGPEPDMGRIGYETAILLSHSDLLMHDEESLSA